jgi:HEAT repeat protein
VATASSYATPVRAQALRLVSLIGSDDVIPPLLKLFASPELREEAIYAVERIPGAAASKAIASAYASAPDDFKPRILAALGHRRAAEGVPLAAAAMKSANKEIASAGAKAYGRIGKATAGVRLPAGEWDSRLRYADAQVATGNHAEAMPHYKAALEAPEEHLQCAAIVGIARMDTAEGASTIFPKLKSSNRNVRITAEQAWKRMASTVPPKG